MGGTYSLKGSQGACEVKQQLAGQGGGQGVSTGGGRGSGEERKVDRA